MKVKEHPEDNSILNKRVWNKAGTQKGTVVGFTPEPQDRYPSIDIQWDDGKLSERTFMMVLDLEIVDEDLFK